VFPDLASFPHPTKKKKDNKTPVLVTPRAPWWLAKNDKDRLVNELQKIKLPDSSGNTIKNPVLQSGYLKSHDWY
jgi:hypothetical protein